MTTFLILAGVAVMCLATLALVHRMVRPVAPPRVTRPDFSDRIPLSVHRGRPDDSESWSVVLGQLELAQHLLADGGLKIEWLEGEPPNDPTVTLVLSPDAVEVDLDVTVSGALESVRRRNGSVG